MPLAKASPETDGFAGLSAIKNILVYMAADIRT